MKRNNLKNSISIILLCLLLGTTGNMFGQDGEFTVEIQHPSLDTIGYGCPGNIVFFWVGNNQSNENWFV